MKKVGLLQNESPLEFLPNLSRELGPQIYVKRDDEGGRGGGGNKLRKYERLIAQAVERDCDTLIIAGHYQSNAARELVGAARQLGLNSIVICKKMIPSQNESFDKTGNALLMSLMKAEIIGIEDNASFEQEMNIVASRVRDEGKVPYIIPFGGSNVIGSLGYVDCAKEIIRHFERLDRGHPEYVVVPTGSGGTHAGLVSHFHSENITTKVLGFSVLHDKKTAEEIVSNLVSKILADTNKKLSKTPYISVDDSFVGDGYGIPTRQGIEAIRMLAELEALFLCPVYTGKAMSGLIDYIRTGKISPKDKVVFVHTGGTPLLYPYYESFYQDQS